MPKNKTSLNIMANIANKVNTIQSKTEFNYKNIDIDLLVENENNNYGLRDIEELAEGIKELGLLQALLVEPIEDGKYKIIAGHRRYAAIKLLGWEKVECKIREDFSNIDSQIALHRANDFRELTTTEKASKIAELERLYKLKKENGDKVEGKIRDIIGQDMNMSGMQVQRLKNIHYKLIKPLKNLLDEQKLTMSDASEFSVLSEEQQEIVYKFLKENIDTSKVEVKSLKEALKKTDEEKRSLEQQTQKLNTKVIQLQSVTKEKEEEIKDINNNIEEIKKQMKEELKKENSEQNKNIIDELKREFEKLTLEKEKTEKEKSEIQLNKEKEISELKDKMKKVNSDTDLNINKIKANIELKMLVKNFKKSTNDLNEYLSKSNKSLEENIELLEEIKNCNENLNNILGQYK